MSKNSRKRGNAFLMYICMFIFVLAFNFVVGGLCTEYVAEFWMSRYKGFSVDYPFFLCAIAGMFLGEFFIPAAIVTFLLSLFI